MAENLTLPVCSGGWNMRDPLDQMPAADAIAYDNLIHTGGADVVRAGYALFSDDDSESGTKQYDYVFGYNAGANSRLLAVQENILKAFDLAGNLKLTETIGDGRGDFRAAQFTDGAGQIHLMIVRGDFNVWDFKVVDGVDSITNAGFTAGGAAPNLAFPFVFKNRLWFVELESFSIWYSDLQAISGELTRFMVGPFFKKSSKLLCGANWTQDGGDGIDDILCLFSDNGEVLNYSGTDPATDFSMIGRFDTERLINDCCVAQIKGDLIFGTTAGYIPLSSALAELSANKAAVSGKINPYVKTKQFSSVLWAMEYWAEKGLLIINAPSTENSLNSEYHVYNFENNTWSRFLGQNARAICTLGDRMFFCREDGIYKDSVGNLDNGSPIKWRRQNAYSDFGVKKRKKIMRFFPRIKSESIPDLYKFVWTDFNEEAKTFVFDNLAQQVDDDNAKWDASMWELSKWADLGGRMFNIKAGIAHIPAVYISMGLFGESKTATKIFSNDITMIVGNGAI